MRTKMDPELLLIDYLLQLTRKSVLTLLRMSHLARRKSYMVIVCPQWTHIKLYSNVFEIGMPL